jgi:hypothetical protein
MTAVVSVGAALVLIQEGIYWGWNRRVRARNDREPDETKHEPICHVEIN